MLPSAHILLIEGKRADHPSFLAGLTKKGFRVDSVPNGTAALAFMEKSLPDLVLVDAASMRTSGLRICQSVHHKASWVPVVLVVEQGHNLPRTADIDILLQRPFTLQKLLNRIRPLLPVEQKSLIHAGPIQLDVEQRWVRCRERQTALTPRLVFLLKTLVDRIGEVIGRKELFSTVWETGYTEDTRTLDVHISWLRQAIEKDPRHPEFIKTVRGIGYRLDIGPSDTQPIVIPKDHSITP
jgi:DNA-binding response OmpR family regulator